jgi:hypothetical protein
VKEGFVTDSTEIVIYEGVNPNPFFFQMTPIAGVPQNQDFVGIAKDANNNYAPLANITAILFNQTLNETNTVITGSDGEYVFEALVEIVVNIHLMIFLTQFQQQL